jgi:hypothetical protein
VGVHAAAVIRETSKVSIAVELAALFHRDLARLAQQLRAFTVEGEIWRCVPGITNSAGNLVLHLEGNLREYVGRILGGYPYTRMRDHEFTASGITITELAAKVDAIRDIVPSVIRRLSDEQLQATFPEDALGTPMSTQQFLIHLHGHLNYHLGQIDYLRRFLIRGTAIEYTRT